jgi:hypothetical protein
MESKQVRTILFFRAGRWLNWPPLPAAHKSQLAGIMLGKKGRTALATPLPVLIVSTDAETGFFLLAWMGGRIIETLIKAKFIMRG